MASIGWNVFLNEELIDTVWFDSRMEAEEVKRSLVGHDGYDAMIVVCRDAEGPKKKFRVYCVWQRCAILEIEADTEEEALARAAEEDWGEGDEVDGSAESYILTDGEEN